MTEETPAFQAEETPNEKPEEGIDALELFPLTFSREAALNAMRINFGMVPPEKLRSVEGLFRYDGDLGDTIKVLWVLSLPNRSEVVIPKDASPQDRRDAMGVWTVQKAERMPEEAYEAAQKWAEEKLGIKNDKGKEFWNAYIRFLTIMKEKDAASFSVKVEGDGGAPTHSESEDPNG